MEEYANTNRSLVDPTALKGLTTLWLRGRKATVCRGLESMLPAQREAMESALVVSVREATGLAGHRASPARGEAFAAQVGRIVRHSGSIR